MRFKKMSMFGSAKFEPADMPASTAPSGDLTPEQAQEFLTKAEQTPSQTISPEEAIKVFEEANKEQEVKETPEQEIARLKKELEEAKKAPEEKKEENVDPLKEVTEKAEKAGVKVSELEQEYIKNGKLSEETMQALKEAGFSEEAVKAYIQVKENQAIERDNEVLKAVGISSRDEYIQMAVWMSETFDEATLAKYDSAMNTPHADVMIEKYYKLYVEANGKQAPEDNKAQPVSVRATTPSDASSQGAFKSEAEMVKAMSDPRYDNDVAYRNEVIRRVMLTPYKR